MIESPIIKGSKWAYVNWLVLTNSFHSSKYFFKNLKQFISWWLLWHNQHLMLLCGIYSSLSSPLSFCSLAFVIFVNLFLKKVVYMTINGCFLAFGNSWVATTSTNALKYTFNCLSNQLSNIIKFKVPSVKLASFVSL